MLRCTIEIVPYGKENCKQTVGLIEIANDGTGTKAKGNYVVVLKRTKPWSGALKQVWRSGKFQDDCGEDVLTGKVEGHNRLNRGVYDLLYKALKVCVGERNP